MTPEQEARIHREFSLLRSAVADVATAQVAEVTERARLKKKIGDIIQSLNPLVREWRERNKGSLPPPRERMRTIDPEDSQSIEISALGARAAFTGKWPIVAAIALLAAALAFGGGVVFHAAQAAQQQETKK